jgi:hypothetical protein
MEPDSKVCPCSGIGEGARNGNNIEAVFRGDRGYYTSPASPATEAVPTNTSCRGYNVSRTYSVSVSISVFGMDAASAYPMPFSIQTHNCRDPCAR